MLLKHMATWHLTQQNRMAHLKKQLLTRLIIRHYVRPTTQGFVPQVIMRHTTTNRVVHHNRRSPGSYSTFIPLLLHQTLKIHTVGSRLLSVIRPRRRNSMYTPCLWECLTQTSAAHGMERMAFIRSSWLVESGPSPCLPVDRSR
jgi:hypothetical protein